MAATYTLATELEPGDRFEIVAANERLTLPEFLQANPTALVILEDPGGQPLPFQRDASSTSLRTPDLARLELAPSDDLWLEYQGAGRFRLLVEKKPPPAFSPTQTSKGVHIAFDPGEVFAFHAAAHHASRAEFELALQAARLSNHAGFDRLICLPLVRDMELLDYQVRTAKTVLQRFRGQALLCDEVGLGKTIEAGLIFSELHMRGLVRSALVLTPPSLIEQWQGEMRRKFSLELISHDDPRFRARGTDAWKEFDLVIASMHTAKREPHRSAITARHWDLVLVDEAHHLRNRRTQLWRLASELHKQFTLLLTATPVQNNLEELFNLVTLLEPGLLRTSRQFQKSFVDRRDKLMPRNLDELHRLLAEVMVRNRRSTVGLQFTRRWAYTERITPSSGEQELYLAVAELVRQHLAGAGGKSKLTPHGLDGLADGPGQFLPGGGGDAGTPGGDSRPAGRRPRYTAEAGEASPRPDRQRQGRPPAAAAGGASR